MSLTERIDRRQPNEKIAPLIERRGGTERKQPEWVRRAQEQRLPASDRTGSLRQAA